MSLFFLPFLSANDNINNNNRKNEEKKSELFFYFLRIRSFPATSWAKGPSHINSAVSCHARPRLLGAKKNRIINHAVLNKSIIICPSPHSIHTIAWQVTDDAGRRMSSVVPYYIQDTGRGPIIMPSPSHETDADANVTRGGGPIRRRRR